MRDLPICGMCLRGGVEKGLTFTFTIRQRWVGLASERGTYGPTVFDIPVDLASREHQALPLERDYQLFCSPGSWNCKGSG